MVKRILFFIMVFVGCLVDAYTVKVFQMKNGKKVHVGAFTPCESLPMADKVHCKKLLSRKELLCTMCNGNEIFGNFIKKSSDLGEQPQFAVFCKNNRGDQYFFEQKITQSIKKKFDLQGCSCPKGNRITYYGKIADTITKDDLLDYAKCS